MPVIRSRHHPKIKRARAFLEPDARRKESRFLVEGFRLLEEAVASGLRCESFFYTQKLASQERGKALLDLLRRLKIPSHEISDRVLGSLKETKTSQGAIGLFRQPDWTGNWEKPLRSGMVLVACGVSDPGNLGTMIRMGEAAGLRGLLLTQGTVEPYHPKVLRASMGSLFRLPVMTIADPVPSFSTGAQIMAAVSRGGDPPAALDFKRPTFLLMGQESSGIDKELLERATHRVSIPMVKEVESLNVAMATAILLYEMVRQNRPAHTGG